MLRRRASVLRGPFGLALALAVAGAGCSDGEASRPDFSSGPVVVEVVEVRPELLLDRVQLVGQLDAELSVRVSPDTSGVLESIEFGEGAEVKAGDALFRLRSDEQRARLAEAEAERDLAKAVYRRTQKLAKRDISSAAQLDKAGAELAREEARVAAARAELERTTIQAPFDGMMGALFVAPGARIEPEDVLTQIDKIDRLQVVFTLPEVAVALASPGIAFEFGVVPYPGEVFRGEVYFVAPTLNPETRRLLVKGWVQNQDRRLRPGLFINIEAEIGRKENALLVPESALALDREGSFVWKVGADESVERAGVETGLRVEGRVEILSGLAPGDRVVAAGTNKVRRGSTVRAAGPPSSRVAEPAAPGDPRGRAGLEGGGDPS